MRGSANTLVGGRLARHRQARRAGIALGAAPRSMKDIDLGQTARHGAVSAWPSRRPRRSPRGSRRRCFRRTGASGSSGQPQPARTSLQIGPSRVILASCMWSCGGVFSIQDRGHSGVPRFLGRARSSGSQPGLRAPFGRTRYRTPSAEVRRDGSCRPSMGPDVAKAVPCRVMDADASQDTAPAGIWQVADHRQPRRRSPGRRTANPDQRREALGVVTAGLEPSGPGNLIVSPQAQRIRRSRQHGSGRANSAHARRRGRQAQR